MNRFLSNYKSLIPPTKRTYSYGLFVSALVMGCSDRVGAPVNIGVAQKTLASAMQSWEEGKTPKDLLNGSPSVFVQEADWNEKTKLLDYEILSDDQPAGPNLVATVKLKLRNADEDVAEKTATYVVSTSPSITVYRNSMR